MDMKSIEKVWSSSLKFLENPTVVLILTVVLVLLASTLFSNINDAIRGIFSNKIVRLIVILLIVYVSPKNPTVGILLAMVYLLSITPYEHFESEPATYPPAETLLEMSDNNRGDQTNTEVKVEDTTEINKAIQNRQNENAQLLGGDKEKKEHFTNDGEEEEEEEAEHFIPFLSNNDFESSSFTGPRQSAKGDCLSTNPNGFELVGNACAPVQAFTGEFNAQGMNAITGFNLDHQMTAQPL